MLFAYAFKLKDTATRGVTSRKFALYVPLYAHGKVCYIRVACIGISCLDIPDEAFRKKFNIQPVVLIDSTEPSNTCKVLQELFNDFERAHKYGIYLPNSDNSEDGEYLHKAYCAQMWQNGVAR